MNKNFEKICRVCMSDVGSRNIFTKRTTTVSLDNLNISSPERLLEKLRYVSLIKIDEKENLPQLLCDLCIIQLNVAYNFKRKVVETDTKLRQFVIENGLQVISEPIINNADISNTHNRENTTATPSSVISNYQHRPFILDTFQIKQEPFDYEILSDITIDTNTETDADGAYNLPNIFTNERNGGRITPAVSQPAPPFGTASMVKLNNTNLLTTANSADIDFISNYMPAVAVNGHSPNESTSSSDQLSKTLSSTEPELIVASTKNSKTILSSDVKTSNETIKTIVSVSDEIKDIKKIEVPIRKNTKGSRELKSITQLNLQYLPSSPLANNDNYTFRQKRNQQTLKSCKDDNKKKRIWSINPANRLRQKIKTEILAKQQQQQQTSVNTGTEQKPNKVPNKPIRKKDDIIINVDTDDEQKPPAKMRKKIKEIEILDTDLFSLPPEDKSKTKVEANRATKRRHSFDNATVKKVKKNNAKIRFKLFKKNF